MTPFSPDPVALRALRQSLEAKLPLKRQHQAHPSLKEWEWEQFLLVVNDTVEYLKLEVERCKALVRRLDILRGGSPLVELLPYLDNAEAAVEAASLSRCGENFRSNQVDTTWRCLLPAFKKALERICEALYATLELNAREGVIGQYKAVGTNLASFTYHLFRDTNACVPGFTEELFEESSLEPEATDPSATHLESTAHQVDILPGEADSEQLIAQSRNQIAAFKLGLPTPIAESIRVIAGIDISNPKRCFAGLVVLDKYLLGSIPEDGFGLLSVPQQQPNKAKTLLKAAATSPLRRRKLPRGSSIRSLLQGTKQHTWFAYGAIGSAGYGVGSLFF